jgi:hypothetical protein
VPPTDTDAPDTKPVPVIVIAVPPANGPTIADTDDTVGAFAYVNINVLFETWVSGFVTTTAFAPAVPLGVVHVNDVDDVRDATVQFAPPTVTVEPPAPVTNPVPVTVISVLPANGPPIGATDDTVGGGPNVLAVVVAKAPVWPFSAATRNAYEVESISPVTE